MSTTTSVAQSAKTFTIGLAWWDASAKRTTAQKIERAAKRYLKLHGKAPNMVYCNPQDCDGTTHPTIAIKQARSIGPNQFYLCISGAA